MAFSFGIIFHPKGGDDTFIRSDGFTSHYTVLPPVIYVFYCVFPNDVFFTTSAVTLPCRATVIYHCRLMANLANRSGTKVLIYEI
jgi:hypothetical protein